MTTDKPQLDATEILQALSDLRRALRRLAIEPPDAIEFEPDAWSRVVHLIRRSFQGLALPPPPPSDLKSLSVMGIEIRRTDASRPEPETAAIESLLAEKAELRAQLAIESKARDALLLENETLRKDAERYRWLRIPRAIDQGLPDHYPTAPWPVRVRVALGLPARSACWGGELDEAIDKAMEGKL